MIKLKKKKKKSLITNLFLFICLYIFLVCNQLFPFYDKGIYIVTKYELSVEEITKISQTNSLRNLYNTRIEENKKIDKLFEKKFSDSLSIKKDVKIDNEIYITNNNSTLYSSEFITICTYYLISKHFNPIEYVSLNSCNNKFLEILNNTIDFKDKIDNIDLFVSLSIMFILIELKLYYVNGKYEILRIKELCDQINTFKKVVLNKLSELYINMDKFSINYSNELYEFVNAMEKNNYEIEKFDFNFNIF